MPFIELAFLGFGADDSAPAPRVREECRPPIYLRHDTLFSAETAEEGEKLPLVKVITGNNFALRVARHIAAGYEVIGSGYADGTSGWPMAIMAKTKNTAHCRERK